ncbi:MAG: amidase [Proteobacteria bacterium]|nr:amidase [Pseudomonadota bacterium]MBI3496638.1 amidase [Pseudomonadota bacterium]
MSLAEYDELDGLGLAELVARRQVSPEELLEAAIERVERRNPALNAVVMTLYDHGREAIRSGLPAGPFRGVPYLLKDLNGSLGGVRTTRGSRFFADVAPPEDGVLVKRLKRAGLVIFGKTNTCEMGLSVTCEPQLYGPTRNPWDPERTPGGSSGGAAAAVAARMVPMAHGADGFGSIRVPAACCGLVGLKPTRGRNSLAPYLGEAVAGLVAEHAVTRSVRDTAALLDATAGPAPGDPYAATEPERPFLTETRLAPGRLRIAFSAGAKGGAVADADCIKALRQAAQLAADLGHDVEEVDPGFDNALAWSTFLTLVSANMLVNLWSHPTKRRFPEPGEVEAVTRATAELGEKVGAADYVRATQTAHRFGRQMAAFHARWDALLTPGLGSVPVKLGWLDMMMDDVEEYWARIRRFTPYTVWFNLTGQPAMALPMGRTASGMPLAVQISTRFGDEATLFRLAAQIEAARPWAAERPPIA